MRRGLMTCCSIDDIDITKIGLDDLRTRVVRTRMRFLRRMHLICL